ncbi:MAG: error-prone DNA polymerase [Deltaproteobacteria bacterium]|nr:error-prone DNA polymerase [Deltaproteobacteria bacterium]
MSHYSELGAQSSFSFLRSTAEPEELARHAMQKGLAALALTDYGGLYGIPRFCRAAHSFGLRPIVGVSLDVAGIGRIRLLCETLQGYQNLCELITKGHVNQPKGTCLVKLDELRAHHQGLTCLAGKGLRYISHTLATPLADIFTASHLAIETSLHLTRESQAQFLKLKELAEHLKVPALITNDVRHLHAKQKPLLDIMSCIHHRCTLDQAGTRLLPNAEHKLKSGKEIQELLSGEKKPLRNSEEVSERCEFSFRDIGYTFPVFPTPEGQSQDKYLHEIVWSHSTKRYRNLTNKHRQQISKELRVIEKLQLAGYFLLVWDIVRFAKSNNIMAQGRGSAANSAVCYVLGITAIDPIAMDLLFERFLSEERGEWPDIDLDLPSGAKREMVIQYVYERYGPDGAAMTANVITYRSKSALRETGKALGFSPAQLDKVSKIAGRWSSAENSVELAEQFEQAGIDVRDDRIKSWIALSEQLLNQPRHLGQHSGGMIVASGKLNASCPIEPASMRNRKVIQWDKDDCSHLGIIKVDLLGLGMLNALEDAIPLIKQTEGIDIDYAQLPQDDPDVYDMLCRADTVGVFQIESRGQMSMLPRLRPRCFYDLVIEIALVRPGPIVGQMVHPYLHRRDGIDPVKYPHPCLEPALKRTLGVPIFQEQLLKIAVSIAGFTGGEAEELRRAMGFKRSEERMVSIIGRLRDGMTRNQIPPDTQDEVIENIQSFAHYGFPESHSASFALIAYASAYLKHHHAAAFLCALLNAQPMGFYHPATLVKDAQRHGVRVLPISITKSQHRCSLEDASTVRLGFSYVRGLNYEAAQKLVTARDNKPFESVREMKQRISLSSKDWATLSELGVFAPLGLSRRQAVWQLGKVQRDDPLFQREEHVPSPAPIPEMNLQNRVESDYRNAGFSVGPHPMHFMRTHLNSAGVLYSALLRQLKHGHFVEVAGLVTIRQRPMTAKGILFITLEDEWGFINLIVGPKLFEESRAVAVGAPAILAKGTLQSHRGTLHVKCEQIARLPLI